ncbi:hypothetical protein KUV23_11730 [Algoriphagus marincola]|uniref:Uncharacterized protein n=1 Tax=Algoriphagus marincola TaxID=264027 RepID=A0ABS7N8W6_9BACT|nr:hypothetical protein [Algoriphagus marincola]MBY5951650.1 hypothetical protein [Algoriphagus marincola]
MLRALNQLHYYQMNTVSDRQLAHDSNRMVFAKNAIFTVLALIVIFSLEGKLSAENLRELSICFTFTPIATGLAGIIFKNTAGLRQSPGWMKYVGYGIGFLAYASLIFLSFAIVF